MDNIYIKIGVGVAAALITGYLGKKTYDWLRSDPAPAPATVENKSS